MPVVLFIYNNLQKALDIIGVNDYLIKAQRRIKMSKYILEEFGKDKGYKIEEQELYKIIDTVFPTRDFGEGWHEEVIGNLWEKEDKKRNYLKLRRYRNYKIRGEENIGYYDYVREAYIITSYRTVVTDVIEKYNKMDKEN